MQELICVLTLAGAVILDWFHFYFSSLNTILTRHMYCVYIRSVSDRCNHSSSPYWLWSDLVLKETTLQRQGTKNCVCTHSTNFFNNFFKEPQVSFSPLFTSFRRLLLQQWSSSIRWWYAFSRISMLICRKHNEQKKKLVYSFSKWWLT